MVGAIVMSPKQRRDTRAEIARRLLACFLAALCVAQPIAQATPACSILALPGQEACCCDGPAKVQATSCCSSAVVERDAVAASSYVRVERCACEVRAPEPLPALPREARARGVDGGSERSLEHWIGAGALASASIPLLEWASPPGEACTDLVAGLHPFPCVPAPNLARGVRGLLAVICVARC